MDVKIEASWKKALEKEFDKDYFANLVEFVKKEYKTGTVYPPAKFMFRAFEVVILGQDPYHGENQANGLAFGVGPKITVPPSLVNIYKEIKSDMGTETGNRDGNLENWARQGVLLLNATLTVRAHQAGSHQKKGWEKFTDAVIKILSEQKEKLVFILWGNYAQRKGAVINEDRHMIIKSPHPSPLSAYNGFLGSAPFSQTNAYLIFNDKTPIEW